ncbi:hypothetical protein MXB_4892 [Myxobolus squamalis]|nr:hypothetical protein MXB_4892 [Myxobolus squamalis]
MFEAYLAKKYPSEKRFGLEGCEVLISSLQDVINSSAVYGVESFVIGMAHRGRLNVLANVCQQPLHHIFCRFNDELAMENQGSSDVKYHLGLSRKHINSNTGKEINVSIVANPSHLEAVDPVVKGRVKAEQYLKSDMDGSKVMSILIHGDAAFSGQGVVYETLNLSELKNFSVHGTIHVVSNNQIGFTTNPSHSRSSQYCTDVAKVVKAPIFHVNADDPEAVARVSQIAAEYRNRFRKDVVIDLVSYRRNGHNEGDNPGFTQPIMYQYIANKPNVMDVYSKKLIESGVINSDTYQELIQSYEKILDHGHCSAQSSKVVENKIWIDSPWKGFFNRNNSFKMKPTGCSLSNLIENQKKCSQIPESFNLHPGIKRVFSQRSELLNKGLFDWAMAEIAAFSSLLTTGVHVRLSGQDVERGTFSHRHHVLYDNIVEKVTYCPLNNLSSSQEKYSICNSSLSEYGVLGFEHGYSMVSPDILTIWEGQFGDFANTAQCIIDQFISSGEDKWIRQSGLVMLLPHGFDGMGPEHSSAKLERYLQLTKEDPDEMPSFTKDTFEVDQISASNYIVAYPTTPANIFHLLRRQMAFNFRKPLVVMSPKNLLRHEMARSSFSEIEEGTSFRRLIEEEGKASRYPSAVKRLVFCSGKIYYELFKTRADKKLEKDVAIARIEQISPFPFDLVSKEVAKYPKADIMYVQEEPKNQGAYYHVKPMILLSCGRQVTFKYVGRSVS